MVILVLEEVDSLAFVFPSVLGRLVYLAKRDNFFVKHDGWR